MGVDSRAGKNTKFFPPPRPARLDFFLRAKARASFEQKQGQVRKGGEERKRKGELDRGQGIGWRGEASSAQPHTRMQIEERIETRKGSFH